MPVVRVTWFEGKQHEAKQAVAADITNSIVRHTGTDPKYIYVIFGGMAMSTIAELIKSRVCANNYDTSRTLSDGEVAELATHAPSAFNLQNWRFVAVRSSQAKAW
jgi:phenylpyruvate tautomerase PptA (4-oxalocrotonate tautomerase family)